MSTIDETHDRIDSQKGDLVQVEFEITYGDGTKRRYWIGEQLGTGNRSTLTIKIGNNNTLTIALVEGCVWRRRPKDG